VDIASYIFANARNNWMMQKLPISLGFQVLTSTKEEKEEMK